MPHTEHQVPLNFMDHYIIELRQYSTALKVVQAHADVYTRHKIDGQIEEIDKIIGRLEDLTNWSERY